MSALLNLRSLASVCGIVLVFCSSFAIAQDDPVENSIPCRTTQNGLYYNFSAIAGTQISGFDTSQEWIFYLNLCNVAPACKRDGAMACQQSIFDATDIYDVAFPNDDIDTHYWSVIPGGIQLTSFGSGIYCQNQGNERRGVVNIFCDPRYTGKVTTFSAPVVEAPDCTYTMSINHTSGCGGPLVTTTPAPVTTLPSASSSTDQSTVTGAGVGVGIGIGVALTAAAVIIYTFVSRRGGKGKWNQMDEVNLGRMGTTGQEPTNL